MTTHVVKTPSPIDQLATHCGIALTGNGKKSKKSDLLGTEGCLPNIDCADCLRSLLVSTRLELWGLGDTPETRWLAGGDTGRSSQTIWAVMTGKLAPCIKGYDTPKDPSDFGRCVALLKLFPAWRARLPEVAARHPEWAPLVDAWDDLSAMLYADELPNRSALYARLKELVG